jgi:UPF0755 protein
MQINKKLLFGLIGSIILVGAFAFWYLFFPSNKSTDEYSLVISQRMKLSHIADSLESHKVIRSKYALRLWLKFTGQDRRIKAGKATFVIGEGVFDASKNLMNTYDIEFVVTIPEGLTILQTARLINKKMPLIDTIAFVTLCNDSLFIKKCNLSVTTLEGYLFPNTYRFREGVVAEDIIEKMVQSFIKSYNQLEQNSSINTRYSQNEIVTIASIVEKEAQLPSERTRISAVFHNRLRLGYPLGADPTVRYILGKFSGPLTVSDLNTNSPFNTRRFVGLPPGPICSPGAGALQAALKPLDTKELYFVAKWDGTGAHDFSFTNEEHNRKKLQIREYNAKRKIVTKD